ncbi:MAG: twin-arginine translocase TatA/TatE family subunit [Candidatus Omnitrophica bacterium]|nr:MAG: Sec-independent protein translocase protein TatAy [Candidatus Hinthialibacteria bacterium OLB16]MCK6496658.1 twin-arginine translocase TatA/TatE family subunit [bacterium]MCL4736202.1 twin-arginine translocase TatA/TatE family subunit [Candidatus Omnitrophota bacterium]NUP91574.1 twin-arginine translocase TatA/TatE family subunit [Candidatus Omnitrophota bacterium]
MFGINHYEILIILLVMVLLFGASRIPELGRSLGTGIREFKNGLRTLDKDEEDDKKKIDQSEDA